MPDMFNIVRPSGLGLNPDEIDAAAEAAREATQPAVDQWNSRFVEERGIQDVRIHIRGKALGLNATDRIVPSPWTEHTAFFMGLHTGEWRVQGDSLFDGIYAAELKIAMGIGIRWMHWPRLQEQHPGCWTFAANDRRQPPAVCQAIAEAIAFAGTLLMPEPALREAMHTYRGKKTHVCTTFRVSLSTLDARLRRLGVASAEAAPS